MPLTPQQCRRIRSLAAEAEPWAVRLRRQLHRTPEPAFGEHDTAAAVAEALAGLGLAGRMGVAGPGVVADLHGGRSGPCVVLRADMDGLAVDEATGAEYRSQRPGFAHACGHDGNMAIVLAAGRVLAELRGELAGTVRLLFQPAEETAAGAKAMIEAGALGDVTPAAVLAPHAWPGLAPDCVACRGGVMMAASDGLAVRVVGRGGHGARPQEANNPIPGLARVIEALAPLSRPGRIVSVCMVVAGRADNVIPDAGVLRGTIRTLDPRTRRETMDEIRAAAAEACRPPGLRAEVEFGSSCPAVVNDERLYEVFAHAAAAALGADKVLQVPEPSMGSEDLGYFLQRWPGLIFRVGAGRASAPLHHAAFDFNDQAITPGAVVLAGMVLELLGTGRDA